MKWVDEIVDKVSGPQHVTDGKTPSGRIHVGSLRGVLIHDTVYKALGEKGMDVKFSYTFDDMDAFDRVPVGLDEATFGKYIGIPLYQVPSPEPSTGSYAEFFANEFMSVFRELEVEPEIIWQSEIHKNGTLDEAIRIALDNAERIQEIYQEVSGSKKREQGWFPFQPICQNCGKVGTTKAVGWDGKEVEYECLPDLVSWAKGCGFRGKVSPFGGTGKLPWKLYWPARWFALGTTIEGEGKDLASKGGARDVANYIAREIYKITPPLDIPYEFFLYGGRKMSTSKGVGTPAAEILQILLPEVVRFLILQSRPMQAINFDPEDPAVIPKLFDDFDKWAGNKDVPRFKDIVNMLQMGAKDEELEGPEVKRRLPYAKVWLERFASEEDKFGMSDELPESAKDLSEKQREFLGKVITLLEREESPDKLQENLYVVAKEAELPSADAFAAIYIAMMGKTHGPKAGWFLLQYPKEQVVARLREAIG